MQPEVLLVNSAIPSRMIRTINMRLGRTDDLVQTVNTVNQACRRVLDWGHQNEEYNKYKPDRATYKDIREDFPSLPSGPLRTARDRAGDMLKRGRFKHNLHKKPFSSIRYDGRMLSVFLESGYCTISTVSGRKRYDFVLPEYYRQY